MNPVLTSIEAEGAVLGAMMLDRSCIPGVRDVLYDEYFFAKIEHQILFRMMCEVDGLDETGWDLVIFRDELKKRDQLQAAGGVDYLQKIVNAVPNAASALHYARIVFEKSKRRRLMEYAGNLVKRVQEPGNEIDEILASAEKDLRGIVDEADTKPTYSILYDALEHITFENQTTYIPSGFQNLDNKIYGLGKGHVLIVAGRPAMGKTALLLNMASNLCDDGKTVVFFSLEMTKEDLIHRLLCSKAGVSLSAAIGGYMSETDRLKIERWRDKLKMSQLIIDHTRNLTPDIFRQRAYMFKRRFGADAFFLDYLQLMNTGRRSRSTYEDVTEISKSIKNTALSLESPVIVGCQINRAVEGREDKRPRLGDLRDSGAIEQDADVVLMLYRPGYYDEQYDNQEDAEILITKNRRGFTGTIPAQFLGRYCVYRER